jgi:hypothetical protein
MKPKRTQGDSGRPAWWWTARFAALVAVLAVVQLVGLVAPDPVDAATSRGSKVKAASGDFAAVVAALEAAMPRRATEGYDVPTSSEASEMADAWAAVVAGDLTRAATLADRHAFDVVRFTDTGLPEQPVLVLLRERRRSDGTFPHAWGLYAHVPARASTVAVEVAHPVFDAHTPAMGVVSFREAGASAFLMAGAHRYANADGSADVAHRADSVFEAIHRRIVRPGVRIYQPHGFDGSNFDSSYGEAVVSRGDRPSDLTTAVADGLSADGFSVCLYDGAGRCQKLAATTNVQGASARSVGAEFVHLEVERAVRDDDSRRRLLNNSVAQALTP